MIKNVMTKKIIKLKENHATRTLHTKKNAKKSNANRNAKLRSAMIKNAINKNVMIINNIK
mgnify:FL=1